MRESEALTDKEYLGLRTLRRRLQSVFFKYSIPGDFEDFFSRYQADFLSGYRQHQRLEHFAIDYLREKLGYSGHKASGELILEYKAELDDQEEEYSHSLVEILREVSELKGKLRVIVGLSLIYGIRNDEIAFLFDVTGSRISHLVDEFASGATRPRVWPEDQKVCRTEVKPFKRDRIMTTGYLKNVEKAAELLGVSPLWLRQRIEEDM